LRKHILFFALLAIACHAYCQSDMQVKNLAAFCKYWGFLKYYHPATSKHNIDWDTVLVNNYPKVKAAKTKENFNAVLLSISKKLGELKPVTHPFNPPDSLSINADFKWMEDTTVINSQTCEYLKRIKKNHKPFNNKYIGVSFLGGNTLIKEKPYPEMVYPNEAYRFLALARYWNIIDYYYPDKYLMDNDWNLSLEKAIPIFFGALDKEDYYRAIEWITARTNDSHADWVTRPYIDSSYKTPPIGIFYHNDSLTITYIINDSIANLFNIKTGDTIISINGKSVREIWQDVKEHHSASNESHAEYAYANSSFMTRSKQDSSILVIIREGKKIQTKMKNYSIKEIMEIWKYQKQKSHPSCSIRTDTLSGKKYGYLNMGTLKGKDVNRFLKQMKSIDYLVLDIRNYPAHFAWPKLANKLITGNKYVAKYTEPDYSYPGYIKYNPNIFIGGIFKNTIGTNGKNHYRGKVIILIDHSTQSQAEYETMTLSLAPNTTIIGTQTSGADGDVCTVVFPGNYKNTFTEIGWFYADGRQTQRIGIVPDIKVEYTVQSQLSGTDPVMQRTLEYIRNGK
jgi:carboxyl-terminal processing protease